MRHRQTKPDSNQNEIVEDLRKMGAVCWITQSLGGEIPDLIVLWRGRCGPVEIKAIGKRHDLTDGEREGMRKSALVGVEWVVAETTEDVVGAWIEPRWVVADQEGVTRARELLEKAIEQATEISAQGFTMTAYRQKQARALRDLLLEVWDVFWESVRWME